LLLPPPAGPFCVREAYFPSGQPELNLTSASEEVPERGCSCLFSSSMHQLGISTSQCPHVWPRLAGWPA
jgi:hypothetical protein